MQPAGPTTPNHAIRRAQWCFVLIVLAFGIFVVRLFYLQVIRYDYFHKAALADQLKEYQIPATRGLIEAHSGGSVVPIVLNQTLYTVYVDPTLIKHADAVAETLAATLGGSSSDYLSKLKTPGTRYVVLAKKVTPDKKAALLQHKYPGVGAQAVTYRTYPNGSLASQLLGFVNSDGTGTYGIEQALNGELAGKSGMLKAVTDINGVPLAANSGNVDVAPVSGDNVVLTIDMAIQQQLETILQQGLKNAKSDSGDALIIDPNTGAVKAMANWPTYDPSNYASVSDPSVFNNGAVSSPLEVGSIMKTLTTAAALDQGAITADETYNDPAHWTVDGFTITNIEEDGGAGVKSIADILNLSLNTGATWELMQMSQKGGTAINSKGRNAWYNYMTNHYRFGKATGIEQGYEATGTVPDPDNGYARDLTYANTAFGQAMTATPLQMAAAFAAVVNGGTYYQPHLVDQRISADGKTATTKPRVLATNVVSSKVSQEIIPLLEYVVQKHYIRPPFDQTMYAVGGKTGTAQIAKQGGGYSETDFNGTYLGFVGGSTPQYVIMVRVNDPHNGGYAGTAAAQPIFAGLAHMLIDDFGVTPKGQ
ncbi:MAG TPA: penicillin-binding protein 2 [Candidatus Saccharimonadales bacterium]|nr:penicillin-binding protein 2 [Candidatus Saccharimonadales bacterium]